MGQVILVKRLSDVIADHLLQELWPSMPMQQVFSHQRCFDEAHVLMLRNRGDFFARQFSDLFDVI